MKNPPDEGGLIKRKISRKTDHLGYKKMITQYAEHDKPKTQAPRQYYERMTLRTLAYLLDDVADLLSEGQPVGAMYEVINLTQMLEDDSARDVAYIYSLPNTPIWELDAKLHAIRNDVLTKQARLGGYKSIWGDDGSLSILNDFGKPLAIIYVNDAWLADSDGGVGPDDQYDRLNITGTGLTSFLAYFSGEPLPITATRLARFFAKHEGAAS